VTVGECAAKFGAGWRETAAQVDHHEIVACAVHLGERQGRVPHCVHVQRTGVPLVEGGGVVASGKGVASAAGVASGAGGSAGTVVSAGASDSTSGPLLPQPDSASGNTIAKAEARARRRFMRAV